MVRPMALKIETGFHKPQGEVAGALPSSSSRKGSIIELGDAHAINELRGVVQRNRFLLTNLETSLHFETLSVPLRFSSPGFLFIVETSYILSHLNIINDIVDMHDVFRHVVVLPRATVAEIEVLQKSTRSIAPAGAVGSSIPGANVGLSSQVAVAQLAKQAIRWISSVAHDAPNVVWFQRKEETSFPTEDGEKSLLDCCYYFQTHINAPVILMSEDKNMCDIATKDNYLAISYDGPGCGLDTAGNILTKVMASIKTVHTPQKSQAPIQISAPARPAIPSPPLTAHLPTPTATVADFITPRRISQSSHQGFPAFNPEAPPFVQGQHGGPLSPRASSTPFEASGGLRSPITPKDALPSTEEKKEAPATMRNAGPPAVVQANLAMDNKELARSNVQDLLSVISNELLENVPQIMQMCAIGKLGDEDSLSYLNINFLRDVNSLLEFERALKKHWHVLFHEVFRASREIKERQLFKQLGNKEFSGLERRWMFWANNGSRGTSEHLKPTKAELRKWVQDMGAMYIALATHAVTLPSEEGEAEIIGPAADIDQAERIRTNWTAMVETCTAMMDI